MNIALNHASLLSPTHYLSLKWHLQKPVLYARRSSKRHRHAFGRSSKLMIESAFIIASKLGVLPPPLELILRDQFGTGGGSGNGFGFGWNGGFFDGGKRKRGTKLGILGVCVLVFGVGLWLMTGKELVLDGDVLLGGLGLILFVVSVDGWRRGAKDWVLGFCCCAFLMGLVLKRDEFRSWVRCIGNILSHFFNSFRLCTRTDFGCVLGVLDFEAWKSKKKDKGYFVFIMLLSISQF